MLVTLRGLDISAGLVVQTVKVIFELFSIFFTFLLLVPSLFVLAFRTALWVKGSTYKGTPCSYTKTFFFVMFTVDPTWHILMLYMMHFCLISFCRIVTIMRNIWSGGRINGYCLAPLIHYKCWSLIELLTLRSHKC